MALGTRRYAYQVVEGWGHGPDCPKLGLISAVGTDSRDQVYLFNRLPQPAVLVFDREGHFLRSWGEDLFTQPHGLWISPDDRVFVADSGDHTVRICTTDGQVRQTLGTAGQSGAPGLPFNQPTWAGLSPPGETFVSDGYGQYRVHRFAPDGGLLRSWGEKGPGPGQFALPHSLVVDSPHGLCVDSHGDPYVCEVISQGRLQKFARL